MRGWKWHQAELKYFKSCQEQRNRWNWASQHWGNIYTHTALKLTGRMRLLLPWHWWSAESQGSEVTCLCNRQISYFYFLMLLSCVNHLWMTRARSVFFTIKAWWSPLYFIFQDLLQQVRPAGGAVLSVTADCSVCSVRQLLFWWFGRKINRINSSLSWSKSLCLCFSSAETSSRSFAGQSGSGKRVTPRSLRLSLCIALPLTL